MGLRIFLKTEQQKVSLKQVSRNLIPAVSPIHHLPSCSTFSSDILINSCYAMIYDDFNLPPAKRISRRIESVTKTKPKNLSTTSVFNCKSHKTNNKATATATATAI